jgi:hypothetical protein
MIGEMANNNLSNKFGIILPNLLIEILGNEF